MHIATPRQAPLAVLTIALAFLLAAATPARAQIIFDLRLSDEGEKAITNPDNMIPAEDLGKLLAEHGTVVYEGEKPLESARFLIFFVSEDGERKEVVASEPFAMKPGRHALAEVFPAKTYRAFAEKYFPDGHFSPTPIYMDGAISFSDDSSEKPDIYFSPDTRPDEDAEGYEHILPIPYGSEEMELEEGGLVLVLVAEGAEGESNPMGFALGGK